MLEIGLPDSQAKQVTITDKAGKKDTASDSIY